MVSSWDGPISRWWNSQFSRVAFGYAPPAMPTETIIHRMIGQADTRPQAPAYFVRKQGAWVSTTWKTYVSEMRETARALIGLDFEPRDVACILGFNRPEWVLMNLAAMTCGGAAAGIYTTCSPPEVQYVIGHAEAPLVLVENEDQWKKVEKELERLPKLKHVVLMKGAAEVDHPMVLSWEQFLEKGAQVKDAEVDARLAALEPDQLAVLIYTSGTTGPPKGVMLSHENLTFTTSAAQELTGIRADDCNLSYLPLSHIAEQIFTIHGPCTAGNAVYYAESIDKVPDNVKEVQPTIFFGVPRIWEKFYAGVNAKLELAEGLKKKLVSWARTVGTQVSELRCRGEEPSGMLGLQYKLATKLIFSKLKPAIGLGRARICVSGAAPISREILEFFASLDIIVLEVYGQSEDTGPTSFNRPGKTKLGTVGPIVPGVEAKIAEDGEILVKGRNVFLGYYKDPEATAETLKDGWLYSGDLGAIDRHGFLSITGRKKEIIVTAGGKNIAPKNIEGSLKNDSLISEAVIIGDRRKYLTVLLTIDEEAAKRCAKGTKASELHDDDDVRCAVQAAIDGVNKDLAKVETVKKFFILPRQFTMEDGELTPTLKIKRKNVAKNWEREIEAMYAD